MYTKILMQYVILNTCGDCPASYDEMGSEEEVSTSFEVKMEAQNAEGRTCHGME